MDLQAKLDHKEHCEQQITTPESDHEIPRAASRISTTTGHRDDILEESTTVGNCAAEKSIPILLSTIYHHTYHVYDRLTTRLRLYRKFIQRRSFYYLR